MATASLLAGHACATGPAITVTYSVRPPYLLGGADGGPGGLTGAPATAAFKAAGIPVTWVQVPSNRQLMMVKEDSTPNCTIGWFRMPGREQFAKFTKSIYRDKAWIVLAHPAFAARGHATLEEALRSRETRLLVKDNYTYGAELDRLITRLQPTRAVLTEPTAKLIQLISMGAADLTLLPEEEGSYLLAHAGERAASLRLLHYKDMPAGNERYLMCSKSVPDDVIARLNKAIKPG
ncbi:hypothetical protein ACLB1G_03475 [Oxalobacteraceae bacterium A2-2]